MQDELDDLRGRLDALQAGIEECRAALDTMAEGDPAAAAELDATVEAMAGELAASKAATGKAPPA